MIWRATATMQVGSLTLDQTLTFDAPAFAAAVAKAHSTFHTPAGCVITGVTLATCASEPNDDQLCGNAATRTDGYCDDCRDALTETQIAELER